MITVDTQDVTGNDIIDKIKVNANVANGDNGDIIFKNQCNRTMCIITLIDHIIPIKSP